MTKENRIYWIDLLKGIAILWLVVYHFHILDWLRSPVPVFFFLSGLFFTEGNNFGSFVGKKTRALLIPFLFFFVLGICALWQRSILLGESYSFPPLLLFATMIPSDAEVVNPLGVGAIWFLVSLFEVYIIYYLFRIVSKNGWWLLFASVLLFLLSSIVMQKYAIGSLFYLFYTFGFVIFFVVANLLRESILFSKLPIWGLVVGIVAYSVRFIDVTRLIDTNSMGGGYFTESYRPNFHVWFNSYMCLAM